MLKKNLTIQILNFLHCLKKKNKKVIGLRKDKLGGKMIKKFVGLRAKTYSYLKDKHDVDKKTKGTKKCGINSRLKTAQNGNEINHLEKNKINIDSLKEDQKEFIKKTLNSGDYDEKYMKINFNLDDKLPPKKQQKKDDRYS